ncbi:hypothetical protein DYBT9623_05244 [Dyadobacter sp. CECT 9623]|uniref:LVIVD repeat-containing protein n=1 Tax=Dyadobacter linearis TaxID=2823330 RepID=A0ABM8UY50_9BACT|nr:hypothetical protein [Dyadobacter sp. CECT 9623]CAG5074557.1 hypothetical protein DYBT9623_05244 [Dyadobacter sp. CECT 9623]
MKKIIPILYLGLAVLGLCMILTSCNEGKDSSLTPQTGTGGSMARFAITGNTLYIVSKQSLEVYNIADGANPVKTVTKDMSMGIETIFPYKNHLFIGANDGMYIYNNSNPANPALLSKFTHVQSCDPVVVQNQYAYVTLRSGVVCRQGNTRSSLDIVDVSDPSNPKLVNSQTMSSPYGLGVSGNKLFVCEGELGLRVMDISDPEKAVETKFHQDIPAYDVIVRPNHLIVTGQKGLFQYQYDQADKFELLSKIPVL